MGVLRLIVASIMIIMIMTKEASTCAECDTTPNPVYLSLVGVSDKPRPRNCLEVQQQGNCQNGVYTIYPYECCPEKAVKVFCDLTTDGGGWTVIQRRDNIVPRENFYRTWMEYAIGFGNLEGEFWLGLDHIHALTAQTMSQIRFDMEDFEDDDRYAVYKFFYVHDRSLNYKVLVNTYSGDAGDAFTYVNGHEFSAKDKDLDDASSNCAVSYKAAWWYTACHSSNPNGIYHAGEHESYADGVNWRPFRGYYYSLKFMEIKTKPVY